MLLVLARGEDSHAAVSADSVPAAAAGACKGTEIPASGGNKYGLQVTTGGGFSCLFGRSSYQDSHVAAYQQTEYYVGGSSTSPVAGGGSNAGACGVTKGGCGFGSCASQNFNKGGRGFPDLVALGWNYDVVVGGQRWSDQNSNINGGTSVATPVVAAMFTIINGRLQSGCGVRIGFIAY